MNAAIKKPEPAEHAEYYSQYINLAPSDDLITELESQLITFTEFISNIPDEKLNYRYAPEKWSIAQIFQHIIDTERIYGFRILNFVRNGMMEIPGFDQDAFAREADVSSRTKQSFADEFSAVRRSTIELLKTITPEQAMITGKANNNKISVRSIAYVAYGHIVHHCRVIEERYLNK